MYFSPSLSRWQSKPLRTRFLSAAAVLSFLALSLFLLLRDPADVGKYVIKTQPLPAAPDQGVAGGESPVDGSGGGGGGEDGGQQGWEFRVERDGDDYGLSEEQCQTAFPKLFGEIDKSKAAREGNRISWKEVDSTVVEDGMVRAMVHHGQVSC